ncbi:MAG: hypothetical protein JWN34_4618 [Bryobacterales bacterium]|nr:hypothetical protein [Bryobacterales bacterium]
MQHATTVPTQLTLLLCLTSGIATPQLPGQDPAALETARSIYRQSFEGLRDATTLDDMRKVSANLDSADWISVDRFGRTVLTKADADRDLESVLKLPPDRRAAGMDIIWAERDAERLIVVAWMGYFETNQADGSGDFGAKGTEHKLSRATLIRDIFVRDAERWHRIRHDKLLPNGTVLAVDGQPRIVPPLPDRNRVTLAK